MKHFLTFVLVATSTLLSFNFSFASHYSSGRISYECIAPNEYFVSVTIWRDCTGIPINATSQSVCYWNNCNESGSFMVYKTPGSGAPLPPPCIDLPLTTCDGGNRFGVEEYVYEGIFTIDKNIADSCQDWRFEAGFPCCRNPSITLGNLGRNMNVGAYLNNRLSVNPCNNSSLIQIPSVPEFCVNCPVTLELNITDPDGDSLSFSFENALTGSCGTPNLIAYVNPFSPQSPGRSSIPFTINPRNGNISFIPTIAQTIVFVMKIEEWRDQEIVGWTWLDFQVTINTDPIICTQNKIPTFERDTVVLSCGERFVDFKTTTNINCNSVSTNGSEIRLFKAETGQAIAIDSTYVLNCLSTTNLANEFRVLFFEKLVDNGIYHLYSKIGSDGNTLVNQCFKHMEEYDTLVLVVKDCYEYEDPMNLINVSVEPNNNEDFEIQWQKPAGFDFNYFDKYLLYRRYQPNGMPWELVNEINDSTQVQFTDLNPSKLPSENSMYYAIQLEYKVNNSISATKKNLLSNDLNSILLKNDPVETEKENLFFDLVWNEYRGWQNPIYTIEYKTKDGTEWIEAGKTNNNFYQFTKPRNAGDYLIRVYTDGIVAGENLRSYSNWTPFCVPIRELEIPNVFTPNEDGINDFFELKNVDFYPNTTVSIFNRWGNMVFESANYLEKPWDGNNVKTGVYYYLIEVPGETEARKGAIKVIAN